MDFQVRRSAAPPRNCFPFWSRDSSGIRLGRGAVLFSVQWPGGLLLGRRRTWKSIVQGATDLEVHRTGGEERGALCWFPRHFELGEML